MCLGVPGRIVSIQGDVAIVDFFGVQKQVLLHIVDEPVLVGDLTVYPQASIGMACSPQHSAQEDDLIRLADGALQDVSRSLMIAFSAVILALLAAAISFTVVNVRKRWYAVDLAAIEAELAGQAAPQAPPATVMPLKKQEAAA